MKLTIGMATHDDFDGVYFTTQSIRAHHAQKNIELIVIDNFGCDHTSNWVKSWVGNCRYIERKDVVGTAAPRNLVFTEATGDVVMCVDCHVLLMPGAISKLVEFYEKNQNCMDLIQGPMMHDDLHGMSTHFHPEWRDHMWGTWAYDTRAEDINGEPFDIPMQGLGLFACRRDAWLGFNDRFRGFGGEEGYIHEKFRKAGRRALCAPWLRWVHRFPRPYGVSYPLSIDDKIRNYLIGHSELGLDLQPIFEHFMPFVSRKKMFALAAEALKGQSFEHHMTA